MPRKEFFFKTKKVTGNVSISHGNYATVHTTIMTLVLMLERDISEKNTEQV